MKLSEFLDKLEFHSPKKSSEYVGKKETNPVMILEENVHLWIRQTDLDDLEMSLKIFEDRVCIQGYPAIYSPQFWIANASLTAIYEVMSGYLKTPVGLDNERFLSEMLFDLWIKLLNAGPGSTHLHMLNIIMKSADDLLWKYMETLKGDNLKLLIRTLRTDFVYQENVSPEHYATLMETHIDKVLRSIFSSDQFEESRRELLDLQIYYLSRMNHVPPHIGPRLSHLCFLICNRYEMENPYLGMDDWVLMRHHLKFIKDVITHSSFTKASEAQYRAPIVLEKILHAAVVDNMLDVMFKDFMSLLQVITNHPKSKACVRLYTVYRTGLFEQIDLKRGFEECPYWLFQQCVQCLSQLANSNMLEGHIEDFIIATQNNFLLQFAKLTVKEIEEWHKLLVNYIVSGRKKLVIEAKHLLTNTLLIQNGVMDWKKCIKEARMLIDIIADLPKEFLQDDEETSFIESAEAYSYFLQELLNLISNVEFLYFNENGSKSSAADLLQMMVSSWKSLKLVVWECVKDEIVRHFPSWNRLLKLLENTSDMDSGPSLQVELRPNVHRCIIKCIEKDSEAKAGVGLACLSTSIPDFTDLIYVREVLFCIEKLLASDDCPRSCDSLTELFARILESCLKTFREKGFIAVDFNSLLMSITLRCVTAPNTEESEEPDIQQGIYSAMCKTFVPAFIQMHQDKGSIQAITSLVYKTLCAIKEAISKGTNYGRSVDFLESMGTRLPKLLFDQIKLIVELFIDWGCIDLKDIIKKLYSQSPDCLIGRFQDLFQLVTYTDATDRHKVLDVLYTVSMNYTQVFYDSHIHTLLDIYPEQNLQSKDFIIKIILNVLERSPQLLVRHVDAFIDEMKFSTDFFSERCKIMTTLLEKNEDLAVKTEDFLMKYITHKDETVAITAMQALAPLIRPIMHAARKARLKVLLKSMNCPEVRTICEELVQVPKNDHKPASNQKKNAKESKLPMPSKPIPAKMTYKPSPRNVKTDKATPNSGRKQDADKSQLASPKSKSLDKTQGKESGDSVVIAEEIGTKTKYESEEIVMRTPATVSGNINGQSTTPLPSIETGSRTDSTNIISKTDIKYFTHKENAVTDAKKDDLMDKSSTIEVSSQQTTIQESKNFRTVTKINTESPNNVEHENKTFTMIGEETKLICIYGSENDKYKLTAFSNILRDAGFDNCIVVKDSDAGLVDESRLVILCVSQNTQIQMIKQLLDILGDRKPLITLKLEQTSLSTNTYRQNTCIRMYTKPGETTLKGQWPTLKFFELLMHLNYQGLLPVDHLLSEDFREWWNPPDKKIAESVSENKSVDKSTTQKNISSAAAVFFSYHWGKQKQVEPLYKYLMDQGVSCWVGLQQIGGSESLYNKISQGIQECRVVLACITPQYTCTENCKQEVNIALGLNRPIIPLLVKTDWPIRDEIGDKLIKMDYIKMDITHDGRIDVKADIIQLLLNRIKKYVPDETAVVVTRENSDKDLVTVQEKSVDFSSPSLGDVTVKKEKGVQDLQSVGVSDTIREESVGNQLAGSMEVRSNRVKVRKSMSVCELENTNLPKYQLSDIRGGSKSSMEVDRRKSQYDVPDGVIIDEFGYTVKSNRSKSCIIL